jgi:hypothetical protein
MEYFPMGHGKLDHPEPKRRQNISRNSAPSIADLGLPLFLIDRTDEESWLGSCAPTLKSPGNGVRE